MTLSFSCCHSLFSALFPHWECFGAAVRPFFTFLHPGSAPQLVGLPLQEVSAGMSWWLPGAEVPPFTLCHLPGICLSGSRAGHCPSLLTLRQPSPPTLLFLTRTGALIHFTPWPPANCQQRQQSSHVEVGIGSGRGQMDGESRHLE